MKGIAAQPTIDQPLLRRFEIELKAKVPHLSAKTNMVIVNPTPLVDITDALLECGRAEYGLEIPRRDIKVYGKLDSEIFGGSVKVRPAIEIIEDAIVSGRLRTGQTIFETTSGNFGLALGLLSGLGFSIIAIVSRKLQEGVADQLKKDGVRLVNLDIDICPAPGSRMDVNLVVAKTTASNVREQLASIGLDVSAFDRARVEIEGFLARQDVIGLAKVLAREYGGFCPEQYDSELNVRSHETITGPEIDQQLNKQGESIVDYQLVCAFGTGGTSLGLSNYVGKRYDRTSVHVIFPLSNQDVAGIRTKEKAFGLRFYKPEAYAGQHEVDFESARRVFRFFVKRGYNIGESSALALYASLQMLNYGSGKKFVVMLADGFHKYASTLEVLRETPRAFEVTLKEAAAGQSEYVQVLWTHAAFVPKDEGIKLIASSLGCEESKVKTARAKDVQSLLSTGEIPEAMRMILPKKDSKLLLVCMVGGTSLRVAELLETKGIVARSLTGGITGLPAAIGREPPDLIQLAVE
jgi:cysteine synthase/rhodanese-related sulfurtransferase